MSFSAGQPMDFGPARDHPGDYLVGVLDVITRLGLVLIASGTITREEAVEFMAEVEAGIDRQAVRCGDDKDDPRQRARKLPAATLRAIFAMPVVGERNFATIDGGKGDEPGPTSAA